MSNQKIRASRCSNCNKVVVPPRNICPYCRNTDPTSEIIRLKNQGTVLSYTKLHSVAEGFKAPLLLALVELEQGAIILALARDSFDRVLSIGNLVQLNYDDDNRLRFQ